MPAIEVGEPSSVQHHHLVANKKKLETNANHEEDINYFPLRTLLKFKWGVNNSAN